MGWRDELNTELEASAYAMADRGAVELAGFVAGSQNWDAMVTLTFDMHKVGARRFAARNGRRPTPFEVSREALKLVSSDVAWSELKRWLRSSSRRLRRPAVSFFVEERQKAGLVHFHGLVAAGGLQQGDVVALGQSWYSRNGYNIIEDPLGPERAAEYCTKYVVKDVHEGGRYEFIGRWSDPALQAPAVTVPAPSRFNRKGWR